MTPPRIHAIDCDLDEECRCHVRQYGVNAEDGFAKDFEAVDDDAAEIEARRILIEERTYPVGTRFEVWDGETDTLVRELATVDV